MNRKRSLLRAGAVIGVALAAGHLVQTLYGDRDQIAEAVEKPQNIETVASGAVPAADPLLPEGALLAATPEALPDGVAESLPMAEQDPEPLALADLSGTALPEADLTGGLAVVETAPPAAGVLELAALTDAPALPPAPVTPPVVPAAQQECTPRMALVAQPQAMLSVTITAPCNIGERVVLRHAGLAIAEEIGADGRVVIDLPALEATGEVSALLADASVLRDAVGIPGVETLRRFAVQWMADDAFQLHAMEAGADYGQPGHVWAENPVSANGGYIVSLGSPSSALPMMAAVYTWPAGVTAEPVVEAAVTDLTCGRELLGETLLSEKGAVTRTDLTLAMPDCGAVGDILVLNNLASGTTLAAAN
ncbi:hypothetical protein [Pseudogemmobacter sonorensis]|uniref:hypothetical protein n=1 Tax=Pseudogemmobacter sonorensis TaxID=2989681 RepID=UPI0036B10FA7